MGSSISQIVSSDKDSLSIDCFIELSKVTLSLVLISSIALERRYSAHFIKFLLLAVRPLIHIALVFGLMMKPLIFKRKINTIQTLKNKLIMVSILIFYLVQPGILQMGIETFK